MQCPFNCGLQNSDNPRQPKLNKYIVKKLETEIVPPDIYCDLHQDEPVLVFNKKSNKLECNKCLATPINQYCEKADRDLFDKTGKILLRLLEKKKLIVN